MFEEEYVIPLEFFKLTAFEILLDTRNVIVTTRQSPDLNKLSRL
jgi:hypothetical protein